MKRHFQCNDKLSMTETPFPVTKTAMEQKEKHTNNLFKSLLLLNQKTFEYLNCNFTTLGPKNTIEVVKIKYELVRSILIKPH